MLVAAAASFPHVAAPTHITYPLAPPSRYLAALATSDNQV